MDYTKFKTIDERIEAAGIGRKINIADVCDAFQYVTFSLQEGYGFFWSAQIKDTVTTVFPMLNSSRVKHFKTFKGCKRNFLSRIGPYAEEYNY